MSTPVPPPPAFATLDPAVALGQALADYKATTGVSLADGDPRRLHLQALLLLLAQMRTLINFSGQQNLVGYVSGLYIQQLAALWGLTLKPATPSKTTLRFLVTDYNPHTIPAGTRATDGVNQWSVDADTTGYNPGVDCAATCTVPGKQSNGAAIGQISTIVDPVPGISGVTNLTATADHPGTDVEGTEAFRVRLKQEPEVFAVAGPRAAYEELAREASAAVEDVIALGPDDAGLSVLIINPGEVYVLIGEVGEDVASGGLLAIVAAALTDETVRPLADHVFVQAPTVVHYDVTLTYYINLDDAGSAVSIQAAVAAAVVSYNLWQRKGGRSINPSKLNQLIVDAGAKRTSISLPAFAVIAPDQAARVRYITVTYGGLERD